MSEHPATPGGAASAQGGDFSALARTTLSASVERGDGELTARIRIQNAGTDDILVLDRLWILEQSKQLAPDPRGIYRFERGGILRLLLGAAPLPRLAFATYRNVPHVTVVAPGASHEREIRIPLPVEEHSPYVEPAPREAPQPVTADRVDVLVHFLMASPELKLTPSPLSAAAMVIQNPVAALAQAKLLHAPMQLAGIPALRRKDIERVTLPGEAPEPLPLG